jgi:hypothetical protein
MQAAACRCLGGIAEVIVELLYAQTQQISPRKSLGFNDMIFE